MIIDSIDHIKRYAIPKIEAILKFISEHDCTNLKVGETEIEGRQLFVRVMNYAPKPAAENRFETHRIYADVQYLVSGAELMQTVRMRDVTPLTDYDTQGDYRFFKATAGISDFVIQGGEFAVFYPNQAHRPACLYKGYNGMVKKLVFKIKIN